MINPIRLYEQEISELEFQNKIYFKSIAQCNQSMRELHIDFSDSLEEEKSKFRKSIMANAKKIHFCKAMIKSIEDTQFSQEIPGANYS